VIVEFGKEEIENSARLPWLASSAGVGEIIDVKIVRNGRLFSVRITMEQLPVPPRV